MLTCCVDQMNKSGKNMRYELPLPYIQGTSEIEQRSMLPRLMAQQMIQNMFQKEETK